MSKEGLLENKDTIKAGVFAINSVVRNPPLFMRKLKTRATQKLFVKIKPNKLPPYNPLI